MFPSFRFWVAEYFSSRLLRMMKSPGRRRQMKNAPILFSPSDWFDFLRAQGWVAKEIRYLPEESERLGRSVPLPVWVHFIKRFLPQSAQAEFQKNTGYALLEPR
jgi:hypothetical protein